MKPKLKFQSDPDRVRAWGDLVNSKLFQDALDSAMLEMVEMQPIAADHANRYDQQAQLTGARLFVMTLTRLHERDINLASTPLPNLKAQH